MAKKNTPKKTSFFSRFLSKIKGIWSKHWKLIVILLIILIGGGLILRGRSRSNQEELVFEHPQVRSITKTLEVSGVVDAKERVRLRFMAGGKLTYLGVKEGDVIKKWQTIATIDQATLKKQLDQDLNNYLKERWDWEQTRDDYVENDSGVTEPFTSLEDNRTVDKAQWDLENSVLNVEIRDIAMANTRLYSPIEGILTTSPTAVAGMQLLATDYFEVVNPDTLVFKAAVDEVDIKDVLEGQSANIELDAYPDDPIYTLVEYIAYSSSQLGTGTVFVIELPLASIEFAYPIRLGMNGDAQIILEEKDNVLAIPLEATREEDNQVIVDVRTGQGSYEARTIEIGLETDDDVEVLSGLTADDEILIPS
jgi:HlyD family secretion protein